MYKIINLDKKRVEDDCLIDSKGNVYEWNLESDSYDKVDFKYKILRSTGYQAVNGTVYENDILSVEGNRLVVIFDKDKNRFVLQILTTDISFEMNWPLLQESTIIGNTYLI